MVKAMDFETGSAHYWTRQTPHEDDNAELQPTFAEGFKLGDKKVSRLP